MFSMTYTVLLKQAVTYCFCYTICYMHKRAMFSMTYTVVLMYSVSHCSYYTILYAGPQARMRFSVEPFEF